MQRRQGGGALAGDSPLQGEAPEGENVEQEHQRQKVCEKERQEGEICRQEKHRHTLLRQEETATLLGNWVP